MTKETTHLINVIGYLFNNKINKIILGFKVEEIIDVLTNPVL